MEQPDKAMAAVLTSKMRIMDTLGLGLLMTNLQGSRQSANLFDFK
jgi:hypothetical protein